MLQRIIWKYRYELCAGLLIVFASVLRIFLIYNHWPQLNADEGIMGIMALHILAGQHPIFFYGQNYMGALEAYVGAGLFSFFGTSPFALQLGVLLLFLLFLIALYALVAILYTRRFALFMLFLFCLGSNAVLSRQLNAIGGYGEILLCGTLSFLLTSVLAISALSPDSRPIWRNVGYACWGLVVGIGLWSDLLLVPVVACSAFTLCYFCWRDLKKGAWSSILLGLILGAFPLIFYNFNAVAGQDSWSVLMRMQGAPAWSIDTVARQVGGTMIYSIPSITGNPFCHTDDFPALKILGFEAVQPMNATCITLNVCWSCSYLLLLLYAIVFYGIQVRKLFSLRAKRSSDAGISRHFIQSCVAIALILQAVLTLFSFIRSHAPLDGASIYARYLICLWITLPTMLWPVWRSIHYPLIWYRSLRFCLITTVTIAIVVCLSYGTYETLTEISLAQTAYAQEDGLISSLAYYGISHVYTDYWTCYRLAFQSHERITCAVAAGDCSMRPDKHNRYQLYYELTRRDPHAAYVLTAHDLCANILKRTGRYKTFFIDNYEVLYGK